jgi:SAM-dependent methyltransferase
MLDINTRDYWNDRYSTGGNSGCGSYGQLSVFKAEILNGFIAAHDVRSMAELGCGDGSQLGLIEAERYTGYDISSKAVEMCTERYINDPSKDFKVYDPSKPLQGKAAPVGLAVSLDVIYHILEDATFDSYMRDLFSLSERFVAIYSDNSESQGTDAQHLRHHRFTDWTDRFLPGWTLCGYVPNRYPPRADSPQDTSSADFYFFSRFEKLDPRYSCLFFGPYEATTGPSDAEAADLMRIARECLGTRELEKSAQCLRQAAANVRVRLNAVNSLGAVLGALGRHAEAEDAMKAVLVRDPGNKQARINITKLYLRLERWVDLKAFPRELRAMRMTDPNIVQKWPLITEKVGRLD